jgi:hypothetical protein
VAGGNRKVRYRGVQKNNAWLHTRTAGLNLPPTAQPRARAEFLDAVRGGDLGMMKAG